MILAWWLVIGLLLAGGTSNESGWHQLCAAFADCVSYKTKRHLGKVTLTTDRFAALAATCFGRGIEGGSTDVGTQAVRENGERRREERQTGAAKTIKIDVSSEGLGRRLELLRQQKSTRQPESTPTESTPTDPAEKVSELHVTWDMHWRLPWHVRWKQTLVLGVGRQGKRRKKTIGSAKRRRLNRSAWICSEAAVCSAKSRNRQSTRRKVHRQRQHRSIQPKR